MSVPALSSRRQLIQAICDHAGNMSAVARQFGISLQSLNRIRRRLGVTRSVRQGVLVIEVKP